jgi:hypothetical protein
MSQLYSKKRKDDRANLKRGSEMGLSKVHFKPNLHIFPYLETEIHNDVIEFFSPETYLYFGIFKKS